MKLKFSKHTTSKERKQIQKYFASLNKKSPVIKKKKPKKKKPINYATGFSYSEFLQTEYWKKIRMDILKRDKYKCVCCGSNSKLQVHHTTYKHLGTEYKHLNDLMTVCRDCHKMTHGIIDSNLIDKMKMQYIK